jgi:spastic paraplegia protein 7
MLGGRVAELIVFNTASTGYISYLKSRLNQIQKCFFSSAQDDLKRATKLAFAQIKQYGMSKTIGLISFPVDQQNPQNDDFGVKPYSKRLQHMMDEVINRIICYLLIDKIRKFRFEFLLICFEMVFMGIRGKLYDHLPRTS